MNWNNYIWLIGGGILQKPMAREILHSGYDLLITDGNENCYCKSMASFFEKIDTYDINENTNFIVKLIRENKKPKAILTDAADVGITVSLVSEIAKLPSTSLGAAETINNKLYLRLILIHDYPVWMKSSKVYSPDILSRWITICNKRNIPKFPIVIKPVNNCASRGIYKINNISELEEYYNLVGNYNKGDTDSILIEQCLSGNEYATDWFVRDYMPQYVNGAKRIFNSFGIELGHTNPWYPIPKKVQLLANDLCRKTNYKYGPLKIDFIEDEKYGWCILEAATRWSGGFDHGFTAKISTNRNLEKPLLDFALGNQVTVESINEDHTYGAAIGFNYNLFNITIEKILDMKSIDGFVNYYTNNNIAHSDEEILNNSERNIFIITRGKDEESAWNAAIRCREIVKS